MKEQPASKLNSLEKLHRAKHLRGLIATRVKEDLQLQISEEIKIIKPEMNRLVSERLVGAILLADDILRSAYIYETDLATLEKKVLSYYKMSENRRKKYKKESKQIKACNHD